jgi:phospholipid/cholesterol/gamma-HCH transport system substrate-binding protein
MANQKLNNVKLGGLIIAGLFLLFAGLVYIGRQQNLFSDVYYLNAYFNDVRGLQEGNNVRYSGIDVGTVNDIAIISDTLVKVRFSVREEVAKFIKKDSHAEIGTEGLMGNKILIVYPGTPQAEKVKENGEVPVNPTVDFDDLMKEIGGATNKLRNITSNIDRITTKLNTGYGLLGKLLNDTVMPKQVDLISDQTLEASQNLNAITQKINRGEGDLGKFLNDDHVTDNMNESFRKIDSLTAETKRLTEKLNRVAAQVVEGNGVINKLLYDSTFAQELDQSVKKIDETVVEIKQASEAVSSSWILRMFSKEDNKNKEKKKKDES